MSEELDPFANGTGTGILGRSRIARQHDGKERDYDCDCELHFSETICFWKTLIRA
jgi:hypothetical protein